MNDDEQKVMRTLLRTWRVVEQETRAQQAAQRDPVKRKALEGYAEATGLCADQLEEALGFFHVRP